jgi:hypothetical protein
MLHKENVSPNRKSTEVGVITLSAYNLKDVNVDRIGYIKETQQQLHIYIYNFHN